MLVPRYFQVFGLKDLVLEDLLTADVLGALDVLPRRQFLLPFLEFVGKLNPQSHLASARTLEQVCGEVEEAEFSFWPGHHALKGAVIAEDSDAIRGGTIPDLIISLPSLIIAVEVKLSARLGVPPDQLPRQFAVAARLAEEDSTAREFLLLTITPGYLSPLLPSEPGKSGAPGASIGGTIRRFFDKLARSGRKDELSKLAAHLSDKVDTRWAWIGWHMLAGFLETTLENLEETADACDHTPYLRSSRRLAERALEALKARGVVPFHGFTDLPRRDDIAAYRGESLFLKAAHG